MLVLRISEHSLAKICKTKTLPKLAGVLGGASKVFKPISVIVKPSYTIPTIILTQLYQILV